METDGIAGGLEDVDIDLSDETQDFRFLAAITKKGDGSIPKRGEKDFEPDGTELQSNTLQDSRDAMMQALSVERIHTSKNRVTATWHPARALAEVHEQRGTLFKSMGRADRAGTLWLLPEELIYMVERGTLECFHEKKIPMSVQAVYAAALEFSGGLERYQVYANLRRSGYLVFRDPDRQHDDLFKAVNYHYKNTRKQDYSSPRSGEGWTMGIFASLFSKILGIGWRKDPFQSLLLPGAYKAYQPIYSKLLIRPQSQLKTSKLAEDPNFNVTFHVWKPKPQFKKSNPGPPDFYISVLPSTDTRVPSLIQLEGLFNAIPETESQSTALYQSLKDGKRSVVLAIVDHGVISYMKFSDSRFEDHQLDVVSPINSKGKGAKRNAKNGKKV